MVVSGFLQSFIFGDDAKEAIKGIIFYQRKLKPQEVGRCADP